MARRVILTALPPHFWQCRDGIPLDKSDMHTLSIGEAVHAERAVYLKRGPGPCLYDPHWGHNLKLADPFEESHLKYWMEKQADNHLFRAITSDDIVSGMIGTEGTNLQGGLDGSSNHLLEREAAMYFSNCTYMKEILFVNAAPHEMYYPTNKSGTRFKHIITGENLQFKTGETWESILYNNIIKAIVHGIADSRIVNPKYTDDYKSELYQFRQAA